MTEGVLSCTCGNKIRITNASSGMVRCPRCGALMATDRTHAKSGTSNSSTTATKPADSKQSGGRAGDGCARCGRAFRGPWDAHKTELGTLCNICVNLSEVRDALHGPPQKDTVDPASIRPEMTPNLGGLDTAQDTLDGATDDRDEEPDKDEDASNGSPAEEPVQQAPTEYRVPRTQIERQRKQWLAAIMGIGLIAVTLFVLLAEGC